MPSACLCGTAHNTAYKRGRNYFGLKIAGNRWRKVFFSQKRGEAEGKTLFSWRILCCSPLFSDLVEDTTCKSNMLSNKESDHLKIQNGTKGMNGNTSGNSNATSQSISCRINSGFLWLTAVMFWCSKNHMDQGLLRRVSVE